MILFVETSGVSHKDVITLLLPAWIKLLVKLLTPSPTLNSPNAVLQAESTVISESSSRSYISEAVKKKKRTPECFTVGFITGR